MKIAVGLYHQCPSKVPVGDRNSVTSSAVQSRSDHLAKKKGRGYTESVYIRPRYSIGSSSREPDRYQTQGKQVKRTHSESERIPSREFSTASMNAFDQDGRREAEGGGPGLKNTIEGVSNYLPPPSFPMDGSSRFSLAPKTPYGTTGFMYPAPPYPASTEMSTSFPVPDASLPRSDPFPMFPPRLRTTESTSYASASASTKSLLTPRSSVSDTGPFTAPQLTQASESVYTFRSIP